MKIVHELLSKPIMFNEGMVQILAIENPKAYRQVMTDFKNSENFILSDDNESFELEQYLNFNIDIFELENSRKILNIIVKNITDEAKYKFYEQSIELMDNLNNFANLILSSYNAPLGADIDIESLIKSLNIQIIKSENLIENIVDFMELQREILGIKVFVFTNIKTIFDNDELKSLYDEIIFKKFNVLLVESSPKIKLDNEEITIIDKDLCEIRY